MVEDGNRIDLTPMRNAPPIASAIMVLQQSSKSRWKRTAAIALVAVSVALAAIGVCILLSSPSNPHDSEVSSTAAPPMPMATPLSLDEPSEREKGDRSSALLSPSPSPSPAPRVIHPRRRKAAPPVAQQTKQLPQLAVRKRSPQQRQNTKPMTIEDLIRMATPDLVPPPQPKPKPTTTPVSKLTRRQIVGVMNGVGAKVRKCFDRFKVPGVADLRFKIMPDGKLADPEICGIFSGTPTGACVLRAAEGVKFAKHSGVPMRINYPFVLRLR